MVDERVTKKIAFLYWSNRKLFAEKIFPHRIGPGQGAFLIPLNEESNMRQEELVSTIGVDKARGTRAVRKLIEAGYIRRQRDPSDQRAYLLSLTPEGAMMKPVILEVLNSIHETLFWEFTDAERDTALTILNRMIENVHAVPRTGAEESE